MADIYFFPERPPKRRTHDAADHGEEINIAIKYGIPIKDGDDITQIIPPDFKKGSLYANEAISYSGQDLKIDWRCHATIVRRGWWEENANLRGRPWKWISPESH